MGWVKAPGALSGLAEKTDADDLPEPPGTSRFEANLAWVYENANDPGAVE